MWQGMGGYTGSMLPELTNITKAGTSLVENAYKQKIEFEQANADLQKTIAYTDHLDANTANIRLQTKNEKELFPLRLKAQELQNKKAESAIDQSNQQLDHNKSVTDDVAGYLKEVRELDPNLPDEEFHRRLAEIQSRHPSADDQSVQGLVSPVVAYQIQRHNSKMTTTNNQSDYDKLKVAQDHGLIGPEVNLREQIAQGNAPALTIHANQQDTVDRLTRVISRAERSGNLADAQWAKNLIDQIQGKSYDVGAAGAGGRSSVIKSDGTLYQGYEDSVQAAESKYGLTGTSPYSGAKKKRIIKRFDPVTHAEITEEITDLPLEQKDITGPEAEKKEEDITTTPLYQSILNDIESGKIKYPSWATDDASKAAFIKGEYERQKSGTPPRSDQGKSDSVNTQFLVPDTGAKGAAEVKQKAKPTPTPKPSPTPKPPELKPGKSVKPTYPSIYRPTYPSIYRHERLSEAGEGGRNVQLASYRQPTLTEEQTNRSQVQSAPAPNLVAWNPEDVDWHTYKFGNSTTFGLNYDGTYDREDNGRGAFGYNTRDPNLIGASVNTVDMQRMFPNDVWWQDGELQMTEGLKRLVRNGEIQVQVVDPRNGQTVQMPLVDIGPAAWTGNILDLTHAASHLFRTGGKAMLGFRLVSRYGQPLVPMRRQTATTV
jgi:hypothetical protein